MKSFAVLYCHLPADAGLKNWSAPDMKAYADMTMGMRNEALPGAVNEAIKHDLFAVAAYLKATDAEDIFSRMQNYDAAWKDADDIECMTSFPRSMSVGDIVYEHDTDTWMVCAPMGFMQVMDRDTCKRLWDVGNKGVSA